MSCERPKILGIPEGLVRNPGVEQRMEYAHMFQELVDPDDNLSMVSAYIDEGAYPVFYSNHNQHINIAGMREVYSSLESRPDDLYFIVAYSLVNSGQDKSLIKFAQGLMPMLEEEKVHFVPVARPKDLHKIRQEEGNNSAREALKVTRNNLEFVFSTLKEDAGLILFPETTTEGAVKKKGVRSGMIEVKNTILPDTIEMAGKVKRDLVFVPVGMVNTNRIVEPRKSKPHPGILLRIGKEMVVSRLGVGFGKIKPVAEVRVGEPILWDSVSNKIPLNEANSYLMGKVAELLPEEARGYYK